jgi:GT2 family glycosyltransferase
MIKSMDDSHKPTIAILILNWNNYSDTQKCLESLRSVTYPNIKIILVDNGSDDGSREQLQNAYSDLTMLKSATNLGFAGGNNIGLKKILEREIPYTLLLNNDTEVIQGDFLDRISGELYADRNLCAVGPKVICPDGTLDQVILPFPKLDFTLRNSLGLFQPDLESRQTVDSLIGCCVLVRNQAIRQVGLLDENYFMYAEETEWFYRMRKAGWKILYNPVDSVIHKGGSSSRKLSSRKLYIERRANVIYTLVKHNFKLQAAATAILMALLLAIRILVGLVRHPETPGNNYSTSMLAELISAFSSKWKLAEKTKT